MEVYSSIAEIRAHLKKAKKSGQSIGFVPTMGALHQGHMALIQTAKADNHLVVCSVFVNPTQFNNQEDLVKYPRTLEKDKSMLTENACDILFTPSASEMYPAVPAIKFDFGALENVMEGKFRPGHFNGVGLVVAKLFHIIEPDRAYFGLKDLQQVVVVNRLIQDLSFGIELMSCPTVREADGLAMSSRNTRLSNENRHLAAQIYRSLEMGKKALLDEKTATETFQLAQKHFEHFPEFTLEYYEICDFETLTPIEKYDTKKQTAICVAAFLDGVRLIDNILL